MIKMLHRSDQTTYPDVFDQMFRARADIFAHKREWQHRVQNGHELDEYDTDADPVYILATNPDGKHLGSLRVMSSLGPTLLRSSFGKQFDRQMPLGDPAIWECSRFCIDHKLAARSEDSIAPKLLIALCEWALSHDVQFILGSFDLSMDRIYKRIGWRPSVYARSKSDPRHIVGLWDATPAHLRLMCSKIEASVNEKLIAEFTIRNAEDDLWVKERGLA